MPVSLEPEKKSRKKWAIIGILFALIVAVALFVVFGLPAIRYSNGIQAFDGGEYTRAVEVFSALPGYKEADSYRIRAEQGVHYTNAGILVQEKDYDGAIEEYKNAGNFRNTTDLLRKTYDLKGEELFGKGQYAQAFASAGNQSRQLDCGILLIKEQRDYAAAAAVLENNTEPTAANYRSYANGMLSMTSEDYQAAMDYFAKCSGLLDAGARRTEATFLAAEKCLHEGYLNKAKTLYSALPDGYTQNGVAAADRIKLLNKNTKFLNLVGSWSATDTYYRVQADSTTSSYYYYWYQDGVNLGTVTVTCPYNEDGTFTVKGTATFPSYQNFSSDASKLKTHMLDFNFSKVCKNSVPYTIDSSSTTKLTSNGKQFEIQYKYINKSANVYWHYTFTSKVKYATRHMLPEDC